MKMPIFCSVNELDGFYDESNLNQMRLQTISLLFSLIFILVNKLIWFMFEIINRETTVFGKMFTGDREDFCFCFLITALFLLICLHVVSVFWILMIDFWLFWQLCDSALTWISSLGFYLVLSWLKNHHAF